MYKKYLVETKPTLVTIPYHNLSILFPNYEAAMKDVASFCEEHSEKGTLWHLVTCKPIPTPEEDNNDIPMNMVILYFTPKKIKNEN